MKFRDFFKDQLLGLILLIIAIITIEIFLLIYPVSILFRIYIPAVILISYGIGLGITYYQKKNYYQKLFNIMKELDQKYLICEMITKPNFLEGKILKEILEDTNKSMLEHVNEYKYLQEDYKEYIELWIHEIKIPIATSKMIIENNKNDITRSIDEELDHIEDYIEQALFYARSNTVEKDYIIQQNNLKEIVHQAVRKNKNEFIQAKATIDIHDVDLTIATDSKWIVFMVNQIIQNSIKYRKKDENLKIEIFAKEKKDQVVLVLRDNGIGIRKGEITRVFEKSFTGSNGRILGKKSTGIGLYLCKKLCDKLGMAIELNSKENEGTEVKLVFPKESYVSL